MTDSLSPERLAEILQNASYEEIRGAEILLPAKSMRGDQRLFPHQVETLAQFESNRGQSGIIHLPTGSGKTRVAIEIIARRLRADSRERILWATYPRNLVRQAMTRVAELAPLFPAGTRMGWVKPRQFLEDKGVFDRLDIVFMMRDDLSDLLSDAGDRRVSQAPLREALEGRRPKGCPRVTLIYDESHQLGADGIQSAWVKYARSAPNEYRTRFNTIGFSATPLPTEPGQHALLQRIVFPVGAANTKKPEWDMLVHSSVENSRLVAENILCPINLQVQDSGLFDIPQDILRQAGADRLRSPGSNPSKKDRNDFAERFNNVVLSHDAVLEFLATRLARNYQATLGKTLVFVPTIAAANRLAYYLRREAREGDVSVVHSKLDEFSENMLEGDDGSAFDEHRQIAAFVRRGDAPCIMVNVGMLTTGFDDPKIRTVVLARLTFSTNLFWQMIGRGSRGLRCGGTADCFVIDPVRLTDKFQVLQGYRPQLEPSTGPSSPDGFPSDGNQTGELDPTLSAVRRAPISVSDLPSVSPALRTEVAEALRAFLRGGPLDSLIVGNVVVRSTVEQGVLRNEFVPRQANDQADASWAPTLAVDIAQNELRKADPTVDLSWLKTAQHMPPTMSDLDLGLFRKKISLVRERRIKTEAEFNMVLMEALSRL
jgi:superfamily II DNA or RNA helicase